MPRAEPIRELTVEPVAGRGFVAAASGLAHAGDHLYVIADDERALAAFPAAGQAPGRLVPMLPGALPDDPGERKRAKPDFEALADVGHPGGERALLALGSGSRHERRTGVLWRLAADGALAGEPEQLDLAPLYSELEHEVPDLNIEGVTVAGDRLLLFQRGNGKAAVNAVVALDLAVALRDLARGTLTTDGLLDIRRHDLGETGGVRLAFSDAAALPDGRVVFSAVAEGGDDTYHDGHCAGAGIGIMQPDGALGPWELLEPARKVEGVAAHLEGDAIALLMVADGDDPDTPAPLLAARLPA